MRGSKNIHKLTLFILVAFFVTGSLRTFYICKNDLPGKQKHAFTLVTKKISETPKDETPLFKRKYKQKGVEVTVPQLVIADIQRFYSYKESFVPKIKNTGATFLYDLQHDRGPPSL